MKARSQLHRTEQMDQRPPVPQSGNLEPGLCICKDRQRLKAIILWLVEVETALGSDLSKMPSQHVSLRCHEISIYKRFPLRTTVHCTCRRDVQSRGPSLFMITFYKNKRGKGLRGKAHSSPLMCMLGMRKSTSSIPGLSNERFSRGH